MDDVQLKSVCDTFELGSPIAPLRAVPGGLTNRVWRLETDRGDFAVKAMNRERMDHIASIEQAFVLEQAAFATGIPMPRPIPAAATGHCLADVKSSTGVRLTVRVHEWVDGVALRNGAVYPSDVIAFAATTLARIHALGIAPEAAISTRARAFGEAHWRSLVERAERAAAAWTTDLMRLLPVIAELEAYVAAADEPAAEQLLSHRDCDPKNHLQAASGELLLVDWDAAGPVVPRHELANQALVWAGVHAGEPVRETAHVYIDAYSGASGRECPFQSGDLAELVAARISWFEFNVRRALRAGASDEDRRAGERVIARNVDELPRFARSLDAWLDVLARSA